MAHVSVAHHASGRNARRSAARAVPVSEGLRPARGLVLGLGLSSLIWATLVALIAF